ncbi:hypothetical protein TNCV_2468501 [Trichonephila clavipes]|nr:hypothetical protein TNCV_2468501 [Trichonephila clavipes]
MMVGFEFGDTVGFVKGIQETGGVMGKCVQMWTRNYGALGQTARVCFGVLCANRTREVKRDFGDLPIRRREGRVVNTPLVVKKGSFSGEKEKKEEEKGQESPGERTDGGRRKDGKEREETERDLKRDGERESEARLEWRKRAESGNWSEKDDKRWWR